MDLAPITDLGVAIVDSGSSANTPNTVVKRDGSGNFSAGTITANLTGTASAIADGSVSASKLAATAISGQTSISTLEGADQFLVLDNTDSALKRAAASTITQLLPAGSILQTQYAELTSLTSAAPDVPFDDTIPQNTEGTELLTVSITPSSASNTILVSACIPMMTISTDGRAIAALFVDGTADAIAVASQQLIASPYNVEECAISLNVRHSPATTSAVTYKLRVGPSTGTLYILGTGSTTRRFGGAARVTLIAQEIKA